MTWSARATVAEADPPAVIRLDDGYCARLLPRRDPAGHKGTFGTVVCLGGSHEYVGAALLTATAAARGGAGLVCLAVPHWMWPVVAGRVPEVVTVGLWGDAAGSDLDPDLALAAIDDRKPDALVVGPGLLQTAGYRSLLHALLRERGAPMVIDGGGLSLLAQISGWSVSVPRNCVLTPHPGEFANLTGAEVPASDAKRLERCVEAARRFSQVVVLKGARTVIASPDKRVAVAPFANPVLATAGSGDVLAGLIGALLAQGLERFDAACLGVYLHGMAGERISERLGDAGLIASDLPYEIAVARHELALKRVD